MFDPVYDPWKPVKVVIATLVFIYMAWTLYTLVVP